MKIEDVFDAIKSIQPNENGCMIWPGYKDIDGYGKAWIDGVGQRNAHRIALQMRLGRPLGNAHALHSCDNPSCCNPDHLSEGTNLDNQKEKAARGRSARGETHRNASITEETAQAILDSGLKPAEASRQFGVSLDVARKIIKGTTWGHLRAAATAIQDGGNNDPE